MKLKVKLTAADILLAIITTFNMWPKINKELKSNEVTLSTTSRRRNVSFSDWLKSWSKRYSVYFLIVTFYDFIFSNGHELEKVKGTYKAFLEEILSVPDQAAIIVTAFLKANGLYNLFEYNLIKVNNDHPAIAESETCHYGRAKNVRELADYAFKHRFYNHMSVSVSDIVHTMITGSFPWVFSSAPNGENPTLFWLSISKAICQIATPWYKPKLEK